MDAKNIYIANAMYNLSLFALIGFSIWLLNSSGPLLGLIMVKTVARGIERETNK